jgi:hypothetical protein
VVKAPDPRTALFTECKGCHAPIVGSDGKVLGTFGT